MPATIAGQEHVVNSITSGDWYAGLTSTEQAAINNVARIAADNYTKSPTKLAKQLESALGNAFDDSDSDAARIARDIADKTRGLYEFGRLASLGYTQWKWEASNDGSTCPECQDMDGEEFDLDEEFWPLHVNCRCIARPIGDRDLHVMGTAEEDY